MISKLLPLTFLLTLHAPAYAQPPAAPGESQAGANEAVRAGERLVAALGRDAAARRAFVETEFSAAALTREPVAERAAALDRLVRDVGRVSIVQTLVRSERHADLILAAENGRFLSAVIFMSTREPGKIVSFFALPARDPARTAREAWPESGVPLDRLPQEIEWRVAAQARDHFFYGTVLVARRDEVLFRGAYGPANMETATPNRVDTLFNAASVGKMFTGVAILALVDQGRISLDDPVTRWVPEFSGTAAGRTITLRQLLSHTSGVGNWAAQFRPHVSQRAAVETMTEPLIAEPGARMFYSNANYVLLGAVLEAVTGQSLDDVLQELVFRPANMTSTSLASGAEAGARGAIRYHFAEDDPLGFRGHVPQLETHNLRADASGGTHTNIDDLFAFHRALLQGRLLSANLTREMLSPFVDYPGAPRPSRYGYGLRFSNCGARQAFGHSGGGTNAGVSNATYATMDGEWTVIVLSNTNAAGANLAISLCEAVSGLG
jgi:CubicO group peptidase (beta-lactamase class C family)